MKKAGIVPEGEGLRKAIQWLSEQHDLSLAAIAEAARRFDLSPAEEDFLIRHLAKHRKADGKEHPKR